jgi:hypothetical protein
MSWRGTSGHSKARWTGSRPDRMLGALRPGLAPALYASDLVRKQATHQKRKAITLNYHGQVQTELFSKRSNRTHRYNFPVISGKDAPIHHDPFRPCVPTSPLPLRWLPIIHAWLLGTSRAISCTAVV